MSKEETQNGSPVSPCYARSMDEALNAAQATASEDLFGLRWFPIIWLPRTAPLGDVFGEDGVLYWALKWDEPEQFDLPEEGFYFALRVKPEHCRTLFEYLFRVGGRVLVPA